MVAADLDLLEDHFITRSGERALLQIYVERGKLDQSAFAMQALKKCMRWDEERFGLELDLERFMIVAVPDFNAGAMENKGLNIFNTKYILARADSATDYDYFGVDKVIAHEYFHNWTGNRVTCRDWFQLSLKEGLTVYRDQEYSADEYSRPVVRIQEVRDLRNRQFPEDAGPMAHAVRPESYVEINNFYTATVYDKGAEVVRMYATLLGREGFRKRHGSLLRAPRRPRGHVRRLPRRDGRSERGGPRAIRALVLAGGHAGGGLPRRATTRRSATYTLEVAAVVRAHAGTGRRSCRS